MVSAMQTSATWFDGRSSRAQQVAIDVEAGELVVRPDDGAERRYAVSQMRAGEPWSEAPLPLALPDGSCLWLSEGAEAERLALLRQAGCAPGPAWGVMNRWPLVLAALVALIALLVWFDRQGAGLAADVVLVAVPRSVDQAVGQRVQRHLEQEWLALTHQPRARQAALEGRLAQVAQQVAPGVPVRLVFARLGNERGHEAGFNAFALPHGSIVVLDGMAERLSDDELLAVLGHELGHVVHRHGMRAVVRGFGLLAVTGAVFGDFSGVVAGAMAGVQNLHYSRSAEREADAFAHRFVAAAGLPPTVLADVWRKLLAEERRRSITGMPGWLSTHPSTEERLREAESNAAPNAASTGTVPSLDSRR